MATPKKPSSKKSIAQSDLMPAAHRASRAGKRTRTKRADKTQAGANKANKTLLITDIPTLRGSSHRGPRQLRPARYKSLRLSKRITHPVKLPSVFALTKTEALLMWNYRGLLVGITLLYGIFNLVFVQGITGGTNVTDLKSQLQSAFSGNLAALSSSITVFVVLVGSAGNTSSGAAGAYQLIFVLLVSLALIWALRQVTSGSLVRVRDAYYRSMTPIIPLVIVVFVIALQLIPLVIGTTVYTLISSSGIAAYPAEKILWALLCSALGLLSIYMITSSVFAAYIVTLPDMTPLKALRSARELVRYRRWTVLRKVLFLPVLLITIAAVILLPVILLITPLTQVMFILITMFSVTIIHTYMYTLYRELLNA
jgi:hypothetical protein